MIIRKHLEPLYVSTKKIEIKKNKLTKNKMSKNSYYKNLKILKKYKIERYKIKTKTKLMSQINELSFKQQLDLHDTIKNVMNYEKKEKSSEKSSEKPFIITKEIKEDFEIGLMLMFGGGIMIGLYKFLSSLI